METGKIFGERLRKFRKENLEMSQKEVSELLGMTQAYISQMEAGKHAPGIEKLAFISKTLGVSSDWLLGISPDYEMLRRLPAEVGQKVFVIMERKRGRKKREEVVPGRIDYFTIGHLGKPMADICMDDGTWCNACLEGEYYLSREEAEKNLGRR